MFNGFNCFGALLFKSNIDSSSQAISTRVFESITGGYARIATVIFMVITSYYMSEYDSVEKSLKRAVRYLIYYAVSCVIIGGLCTIAARGKGWRWIIKGLFPLTTHPLWYVSCYIMFLFIIPLVNVGLREISEKERRYCAIALLFSKR